MSPATRRRPPAARAARALRRAGAAAAGAVPAVPARWRARAVGMLALLTALALGWFGWFRDSSFVAVENVEVAGVSGPQARAIRGALVDAARGMTTLNVREDDLREAVRPYPTIAGLSAEADFPDTLTITVREAPPVAALRIGGRPVPVGRDGSLLTGVRYVRGLPLIWAEAPPGARRLESGRAHGLLTVLAEAPPLMLRRVRDVRYRPGRGAVVRLRSGPDLIFGDSTRLRAKWIAATRVLASQGAKGATYLDLRLPERPAAGGLAEETIAATGTPEAPVVPAPAPAAPAVTAPPTAPAQAPVVPQGNAQPQVESHPQPSTQP